MTNQIFIERLRQAGVDTDSAINRFMGNEALFLKFMRRLPDTLKIAEMKQTLEEENGEDFYSYVHDLKGVAGNLGLSDIFDAAQATLVEYRSTQLRNKKKMVGLLSEIEEYCQKVFIILEEDISENGAD